MSRTSITLAATAALLSLGTVQAQELHVSRHAGMAVTVGGLPSACRLTLGGQPVLDLVPQRAGPHRLTVTGNAGGRLVLRSESNGDNGIAFIEGSRSRFSLFRPARQGLLASYTMLGAAQDIRLRLNASSNTAQLLLDGVAIATFGSQRVGRQLHLSLRSSRGPVRAIGRPGGTVMGPTARVSSLATMVVDLDRRQLLVQSGGRQVRWADLVTRTRIGMRVQRHEGLSLGLDANGRGALYVSGFSLQSLTWRPISASAAHAVTTRWRPSYRAGVQIVRREVIGAWQIDLGTGDAPLYITGEYTSDEVNDYSSGPSVLLIGNHQAVTDVSRIVRGKRDGLWVLAGNYHSLVIDIALENDRGHAKLTLRGLPALTLAARRMGDGRIVLGGSGHRSLIYDPVARQLYLEIPGRGRVLWGRTS